MGRSRKVSCTSQPGSSSSGTSGRGTAPAAGGLTGKHKQQPLARGGGVGAAALRPLAQAVPATAGLRLGDGGATALAVETPAVIRALQLTALVEAALAEGHQAVGADISEGAPLAGGGIPPEHQVLIQEGEGEGAAGIQILQAATAYHCCCQCRRQRSS
jgi:hypothetical protein